MVGQMKKRHRSFPRQHDLDLIDRQHFPGIKPNVRACVADGVSQLGQLNRQRRILAAADALISAGIATAPASMARRVDVVGSSG
jgi:hypothetical protein